MKYATTKKAIMDYYPNVIKVGYCSLQTLLKFRSPDAYTASRTYGWRADVYEITCDTVIVTGYAPFGNIIPDYETIKKYEEKAQELCEKYQQPQERVYREFPTLYAKIPVSYDEVLINNQGALDDLLHEFVQEVKPNKSTPD